MVRECERGRWRESQRAQEPESQRARVERCSKDFSITLRPLSLCPNASVDNGFR